MIEESKNCSVLVKKHCIKELVMTKEDNGIFKNSTKRWICDNCYINNDSKVRNHCHITGGSTHKDGNINLKLNQKSLVLFHNIKNYDSHIIMQEIFKFHLKTSVVPNGWGKIYEIYNQLQVKFYWQLSTFKFFIS